MSHVELREATVKRPIAPEADRDKRLFFLFRLHSELHDGCVFLVLAPGRAMTPPSSVREVRASEVSDPNVTTETGRPNFNLSNPRMSAQFQFIDSLDVAPISTHRLI